MSVTLPLHPRHGLHAPTDATPPRRPGSVRRTSTVDVVRPGVIDEGSVLLGRSRDLYTGLDGAPQVLATARTRVEVGLTPAPIVRGVEVEPGVAGLDTLIGLRASSGFRGAIDAGTDARPGTGEYLLLDDVPVCVLVSGYALLHATARGDRPALSLTHARSAGTVHGVNACAGFRTGGTIMTAWEAGENAVATGPEAPSVLDPDDPIGWHEFPGDLPADGVRRWRRIDAWRDADGLHLNSFYRDSHVAPDSTETIIHEYTVDALVDLDDLIVRHCVATPRVLPFVECPAAVDSATRLAGMHLDELRTRVRAELRGTSTCTHLNDQLRSLADAEHLSGLLQHRAVPAG